MTKHLEVLAGAGLARSITSKHPAAGPQGASRRGPPLELISRRWDEALERLKLALEDEPR